jgi:hypothetical protein
VHAGTLHTEGNMNRAAKKMDRTSGPVRVEQVRCNEGSPGTHWGGSCARVRKRGGQSTTPYRREKTKEMGRGLLKFLLVVLVAWAG